MANLVNCEGCGQRQHPNDALDTRTDDGRVLLCTRCHDSMFSSGLVPNRGRYIHGHDGPHCRVCETDTEGAVVRATVRFNGHFYQGTVLDVNPAGTRASIRFTTGTGCTRERRFSLVPPGAALPLPGMAVLHVNGQAPTLASLQGK